jgi:hypothetical protein
MSMGGDVSNNHEDDPIDADTLVQLSRDIDLATIINMYVSLFLLIVGLIGNFTALAVFVRARRHKTKIAHSGYMLSLTVTNTLYLLICFYYSTLSRIIFHFELDKSQNNWLSMLYITNSDLTACRVVRFSKNFIRLLSNLITLMFSCERVIVIYFPLKLYRILVRKTAITIFLLAFAAESYVLAFTQIIPVYDGLPKQEDFRHRVVELNLTAHFNYHSILPAFRSTFCSLQHQELVFKLHGLNAFTNAFTYIAVAISIIIIVAKLNRSYSYKKTFTQMSSNEKKRNSGSRATGALDGEQANQFELKVFKKEDSAIEAAVDEIVNDPDPSRNRHVSFARSGQGFHNSAMLLAVSACFVLLNLPCLILNITQLALLMREADSDRSFLTTVFLLKKYLILTEILNLANFSIGCLLFFCTGKLFRIHLRKLFI